MQGEPGNEATCTLHVTISSTDGKFRPVSNFVAFCGVTLSYSSHHSYAHLMLVIARVHNSKSVQLPCSFYTRPSEQYNIDKHIEYTSTVEGMAAENSKSLMSA